ncbi:MAG TPA: winged helix-turn-helix transcriptional regulator [Solirubrobacteraceae bacterium]|jgi:DNA-binding HxlR family transcriptional regulator|nr:winged helix-turn-helix transcriptional regulator [Solirubrobacteraceae bacterium]
MSSTGLELARKPRDSSDEELRRAASAREPAAEGRATAAPRERADGRGAAAPRVLADVQTRTIVLALADGSRRPSELERLQGIVRSTLFVRLGELRALGIVTSCHGREFPLRVEYRLNESGRRLLANELLIERQERRKLARTGPGVDAALGNLLRLLAPVSRPATDRQGHCLLVEREPSGRTHTVRLLVEDHRVEMSELAGSVEPDVRFSAASEAWEDALLVGGTHGLQMAGDLVLGRAVMVAFGAALND